MTCFVYLASCVASHTLRVRFIELIHTAIEDHGLRVVVWQGLRNLNDKDGRVGSKRANMKYSGDIADLFRRKVIIPHLSQERYRSYNVASELGACIPRSEEERGDTRHGDSQRGVCCNDHRKGLRRGQREWLDLS
jgi:hypothetical protein